jgi:hypothetical protein
MLIILVVAIIEAVGWMALAVVVRWDACPFLLGQATLDRPLSE